MSVPAAYVGMVLIWSTTPLAIQWSSEDGGFLFAVTARMSLALVLCYLLARIFGVTIHWHRRALIGYVASALGLFPAMVAVYWGAQYIPSGLVAVLYGLLPMVTTIVSALWLQERLWQPPKLLGICLGVLGLAVIFDPRVDLTLATAMGVGGVLMSTLLHAMSMTWLKRIDGDMPALALTTGGLMVAVPMYLMTCLLLGTPWPAQLTWKATGAIAYLSVMGSVFGFLLFYYVLKRTSPNVIALVTLVTPVLALLWGFIFNNEALELRTVAGAALILSGLSLHHWGGAWWRQRMASETV